MQAGGVGDRDADGNAVVRHGAAWRAGGWALVGLLGALAAAGTVAFVVAIVLAASSGLTSRVAAASPPISALGPGDSARYISVAQMDSADAVLRATVAARVIPGAALAIGQRGHILQLAGYGRVGWTPRDPAVSADSTIYDLASLTKAIATTSAVLLLVQDGKIKLDDPVQRVLPEFSGLGKDHVTWRHLLTHTSGLPPGAPIRGKTPAARLANLLRTRLNSAPGTYVQYSDLSFITLWAAAQRVAHEPLPKFLQRRLWRPLGMNDTDFWPGTDCDNCAPTLVLHSGEPYRGKPSDPIAHKLGVPTGNAGLFSTAHDLARFAAMIANGGSLDGVRIFRPDIVHQLFVQEPDAGHRTLGWEAFCPLEHLTQQQPCKNPIAYGHTGWTGTSLWIDPKRGAWAVILSNRSYDVKRPPSLENLRRDVFLHVAKGAAPKATTKAAVSGFVERQSLAPADTAMGER